MTTTNETCNYGHRDSNGSYGRGQWCHNSGSAWQLHADVCAAVKTGTAHRRYRFAPATAK